MLGIHGRGGSRVTTSAKAVRSADTIAGQLAGDEGIDRQKAALLIAHLRAAVTDEIPQRRYQRLWAKTRRLEAQVATLRDYQCRVTHHMALQKNRTMRTEIEAEHREIGKLGFIGAWVPGALVRCLLAIFIVFDVPYADATFRSLLDIPTSIPWWDITDMANLAALALSGALSVITLASVGFGAKTWAFLAYRRFDRDPEVLTYPRAELRRHIRVPVKALLSLVGIVFVCVVLHQISQARFSATLFSGNTGSSTLIWLATSLPAMAYLLSIAAESPRFVHARRVQRAAFWQGVRRLSSLRRERRLQGRCARSYARFEGAFDKVSARLRHSGLAVTWEALVAALDGSLTVNDGSSKKPGFDTDTLPRGRRWVNTAGAETTVLDNPFPTAHSFRRTQFVFSQMSVPTLALVDQWRQFHENPSGYKPLDPALHSAIPTPQTVIPNADSKAGPADRTVLPFPQIPLFDPDEQTA